MAKSRFKCKYYSTCGSPDNCRKCPERIVDVKGKTKAERLYATFQKANPDFIADVKLNLPKDGDRVVFLGVIKELVYVWPFDKQYYRHTFKNGATICSNEQGDLLMIDGVRVTDRGIEDGKPKFSIRR